MRLPTPVSDVFSCEQHENYYITEHGVVPFILPCCDDMMQVWDNVLHAGIFSYCCLAIPEKGSLCAGEEMSVGRSQNNYLAIEVRVVSSGLGGSSLQGSLITYWPGVPGQGANGCSATVKWPILDNVTVLGVPAVNAASVAVQVRDLFTANV